MITLHIDVPFFDAGFSLHAALQHCSNTKLLEEHAHILWGIVRKQQFWIILPIDNIYSVYIGTNLQIMEKRFIQELCHWIILSWWLMLPNKSCSLSVSCKVLAALIVNCKLKCAAIRAKWSILLPQMKTISSSVFRLSGCHQDSWSFIKPFQVLFSIITILCDNNNTNTTRCRYI